LNTQTNLILARDLSTGDGGGSDLESQIANLKLIALHVTHAGDSVAERLDNFYSAHAFPPGWAPRLLVADDEAFALLDESTNAAVAGRGSPDGRFSSMRSAAPLIPARGATTTSATSSRRPIAAKGFSDC